MVLKEADRRKQREANDSCPSLPLSLSRPHRGVGGGSDIQAQMPTLSKGKSKRKYCTVVMSQQIEQIQKWIEAMLFWKCVTENTGRFLN